MKRNIPKNIGLISYHYLHNYGTMLQAYALQRKICDYGIGAEYIDYRFTEDPKKRRIWLRLANCLNYLFKFKHYFIKLVFMPKAKIRTRKFIQFFNAHLKTGNKKFYSVDDLESAPPEYDFYIVGSDQVWNPTLSSASRAYFLSFVKDNWKKASYAPSLGLSSFSKQHLLEIKSYTSQFEFLSCREKHGAASLQNLCQRTVVHVLDPTFLINRAQWEALAVNPDIAEPYVLAYFLGHRTSPRLFAQQLARDQKMNIYYIPCSPVDMKERNALYNTGPAEFLGLIKNAAFVCTDSFHGTVFSIIFEKQFFSFLKRDGAPSDGDNNRIKDLLERFQIEDRLIRDVGVETEICNGIDYEAVNPNLFRMIAKSENYLKAILNLSAR